jgi:hypothetical protein
MQFLNQLKKIQQQPSGSIAANLLQEHAQHSIACAIHFSNRVEGVGCDSLFETELVVRTGTGCREVSQHVVDSIVSYCGYSWHVGIDESQH